ncbi:PEP-CTERM sorting domain-containing protein [Luteolibacter pohnpeiensis]|uniref:PEP-CTERM sorting domain-containing protein n=1 Tax=Luteolibacter pohnpeiensis TaxID=454153 RepID=A0A934S7U2_9BACT|nr:PEP-CTERM sorting domain-containing protein [Luteolibacter pohnpeiensis]MBK1883438.1 PEP-CTERM sorting domain-containing protein [Luteolibacter pohnpeiensis]
MKFDFTIIYITTFISLIEPTQAALNILVTEGNRLLEYSPDGDLVMDYGVVPHPDTTRYDATDVVATPDGKIHVLNSAPGDNDYLSTLQPSSRIWSHTPDPAGGFGNVSDADLSILGNVAVTNRVMFDLNRFTATQFSVPGFGGVGEVSFGLDGLLYALDSGSPRGGLRVLDPTDFSLLREFELLDSAGFRLDARGIAVREDGQIYIADWNGRIYEYDPTGNLVKSVYTGTGNLLDIDLSAEGTLIAGSRFGDVVVTDTTLATISTFSVGSGLVYVGFQIPEPTSLSLTLLVGIGLLRRKRR